MNFSHVHIFCFRLYCVLPCKKKKHSMSTSLHDTGKKIALCFWGSNIRHGWKGYRTDGDHFGIFQDILLKELLVKIQHDYEFFVIMEDSCVPIVTPGYLYKILTEASFPSENLGIVQKTEGAIGFEVTPVMILTKHGVQQFLRTDSVCPLCWITDPQGDIVLHPSLFTGRPFCGGCEDCNGVNWFASAFCGGCEDCSGKGYFARPVVPCEPGNMYVGTIPAEVCHSEGKLTRPRRHRLVYRWENGPCNHDQVWCGNKCVPVR